jgi:hypothetical protein
MPRALSLLLLALIITSGAGCAHGGRNPKSSARIYEGDSPNVHMTERQHPGGPLTPYR